jgi:hypothetical protein
MKGAKDAKSLSFDGERQRAFEAGCDHGAVKAHQDCVIPKSGVSK